MLRPSGGWFSAMTMIVFITVMLAMVIRISALLVAHSWPVNAPGHFQDAKGASPPLGGLGTIPLPPSL
jgi:hypothetical protein